MISDRNVAMEMPPLYISHYHILCVAVAMASNVECSFVAYGEKNAILRPDKNEDDSLGKRKISLSLPINLH